MTAERVWAVVAAAGDGHRLGHERPKAFVKLGGRPLLAYAIELLEAHPRVERIVVVVPEGWEEPTALLADELAAGKVAQSVAGGAARALSVAAGLAEVPGSATAILVHDAARPFASEELVDRVLDALATADGAVPGVPVADTVKRVGGGAVVETLDRGELRAAQTPQAFRAETLRRAYAGPPEDLAAATDCAQLVERAGGRVVVVDGEAANAKITGPDDLARAEAHIGRRA
ncbi:MAG TPA: 2-C-methyl-D-erythritol 4-phosphate cytidylyltransferase [Gaiellales bacterium]|nr:2-C-methyl-D-erythritol 4-phosphate cytidylyltransferase [Gaiellales bacterium]